MKIEGRMLYADEGKVIDFKEPQWALDDENTPIQRHLYVTQMKLGRMDSADRYIEIDASEIKED